jgi:hypothetical protein
MHFCTRPVGNVPHKDIVSPPNKDVYCIQKNFFLKMSVYIYERHIKMTNDYIIFSIENPNLKVLMKHQHFSVDLLSLDFIPETLFPIVLNLVLIGCNR